MDLEQALAAHLAGKPKAEDRLAATVIRVVRPVFAGRFDAATVEDLCQEAAARVFANLDDFDYRGTGSFKGWVYQIARNLKLAQLYRENRYRRLETALAQNVPPKRLIPTEHMQWRERLTFVRHALAGLDPKFTDAVLHLASGGTPRELAETAGVSPHTIRSRASRAVQHLRKKIDAYTPGSTPFLATPKTWG